MRGARAGVVAVALALASGARAQDVLPEAPHANYLVPALEVPAINLSLSLFNAAVFQSEWTHVSLQSIGRNLQGGWVFDEDNFEINNIGHPYQGSIYFNAARSSGLPFFQSMVAAFGGSLLWELFGEAEPPSVNDMLTTPFGGSFLGEALHRTALVLLRAPGNAPSWLRLGGAVLLDPASAFNRWLFDGRYEPPEGVDDTPLISSFSVGMNALGFLVSSSGERQLDQRLGDEVHLSARLRGGFPGVRGFAPRDPFDHFDVQVELSFSRQPYGMLFVSGLLWGRAFEFLGTGAGVFGFFGNYDFANASVLRVATVSVGTGTAFAVDLNDFLQLQGSLVASAIGWGAAGALPNISPDARDYHIGPGLQGQGELALVSRTAGALHARLREYVVTGAYGAPGQELISYLTLGGAAAMSSRFELTFDVVISTRSSRYLGQREDVFQRATQLRVGLVWRSEPAHGATRGPPP